MTLEELEQVREKMGYRNAKAYDLVNKIAFALMAAFAVGAIVYGLHPKLFDAGKFKVCLWVIAAAEFLGSAGIFIRTLANSIPHPETGSRPCDPQTIDGFLKANLSTTGGLGFQLCWGIAIILDVCVFVAALQNGYVRLSLFFLASIAINEYGRRNMQSLFRNRVADVEAGVGLEYLLTYNERASREGE